MTMRPLPAETPQQAKRRVSRHGGVALIAMLAPAVLFPSLLAVAATGDRFAFLRTLASWPIELWTIAFAGTLATIGGLLDWRFHRSGDTSVGDNGLPPRAAIEWASDAADERIARPTTDGKRRKPKSIYLAGRRVAGDRWLWAVLTLSGHTAGHLGDDAAARIVADTVRSGRSTAAGEYASPKQSHPNRSRRSRRRRCEHHSPPSRSVTDRVVAATRGGWRPGVHGR